MNQDRGANLFLLTPLTQLAELLRQLRPGSKQRCSLGRLVPYVHNITTRISVLLQDVTDDRAAGFHIADGEEAVVVFILLITVFRFRNSFIDMPWVSTSSSMERDLEKENLPRRQSQERCPSAWVGRAQRRERSGKTFLIALPLFKIERLKFRILCRICFVYEKKQLLCGGEERWIYQ